MRQDTLEGRAKTKNGVIRLCFSVLCILLEAAFIIIVITRLNEYAEIVNLLTRVFAGILVLALYASDQTSSMKMPWIMLILAAPVMGLSLFLLFDILGDPGLGFEMRPGFLLPPLMFNADELEALLLGARLVLHILLQHALLLLLLDLHLILHPLLAGDDVPRLVGVVVRIERLRQNTQRHQRRQK